MEKPSVKDQQELISINANKKDTVEIPHSKDKWKVGWICERALEKVSLLDLESGVEVTSQNTRRNIQKRSRLLCKAASYLILNGIKIFFFHWIFWRYLYYIKGYSADQLIPIIELAKKKAPLVESLLASMLVSQLKITNPALTQAEVESFLPEHLLESNQPSEKSTDGL